MSLNFLSYKSNYDPFFITGNSTYLISLIVACNLGEGSIILDPK